jgi:hypothetical protein
VSSYAEFRSRWLLGAKAFPIEKWRARRFTFKKTYIPLLTEKKNRAGMAGLSTPDHG